MTQAITSDNFALISQPDFLAYAARYAQIEQQAVSAIEQFGLLFRKDEAAKKEQERYKLLLRKQGAAFENNGKSIHSRWVSSACTACRTGEGSYTTFISLKCHRDCYFCFNPNQEDYAYFQEHQRAADEEIGRLAQMPAPLTHIALTGGEPLIHKKESVRFFSEVKEKFSQAHSRLYTAGDPLTESTAKALKRAGLQEIRFSIKIDDPQAKQKKVLERIAIARKYIPAVMVEMPVLPDTLPQMQKLLLQLETIGIDGINLLEFCFPLCNAQAYQQRGFELKYPPYEAYYNYWYAGGLAIAGSELTCLQLLLFALEKNLKLGVHYCSLENKHTGQVYQQNSHHSCDALTVFSMRDYFLKTAKVFGKTFVRNTQKILTQHKQSFQLDRQHAYIQFHPGNIPLLEGVVDEVCVASFIVEQVSEKDVLMKEVQLALTSPKLFQLSDILVDGLKDKAV